MDWILKQQKLIFLHFWKLEVQDQAKSFLPCLQTAIFSLFLHMGERERERERKLSGVSSNMDPILMASSTSTLNYILKAASQTTSHWGLHP
jgi:hypothetical protein